MAKNKGGRPKIEWGDDKWTMFEGLCAIMCTEEEICMIMGNIDHKTLYRLIKEHYDGESYSQVYKRFSSQGKASLRRYQFEQAKKNVTMAIWLGKQWLGQRDEAIRVESDTGNELLKSLYELEKKHAD